MSGFYKAPRGCPGKRWCVQSLRAPRPSTRCKRCLEASGQRGQRLVSFADATPTQSFRNFCVWWTGFVLAGFFFPDPVPENIMFPLGNLFSPNFGIFKVQGGCPMEKYSATLGLQPKKSVEFLGVEFVGDLQRDKQDLGHWNFIQRCLPPWSQNWFWMFFVYHVRLGVVPLFGNGHLFRKKLGPKKFIRDKFGYNTP